MRIDDALMSLYSAGYSHVTAAQVAEILWPEGRTKNGNGQVFHLGAARAAAMLRGTRAAFEVEHRRWEIVPEYLSA